MNDLAAVLAFRKVDCEVSAAVLADANDALLRIGNSSHSVGGEDMLLAGLMETVGLLRGRGVRFSEIADCLRGQGLDWSAEDIQDCYCQFQDARLAACERRLSGALSSGWNASAERAAAIERGLRASLDSGNGLVLHYQPQVDMRLGTVLGAEALLRWEFDGKLASSAEFIPVAESSGLIVPIGEWVLREACREARRWRSMGLGGEPGLKVGVNLSVKQFSDGLPALVHEILCDMDLPTHLLGLEITESFLVGNDSLGMLHSLRDSGIHLSIDDFGTGYSCLAQLKDLPLDTIKIDRTFVQDIGNGRGSVVAEAIIGLARRLGVTTLAEGVETLAQAKALMELGCSVCQGFFYSKPLTGERFVEFVGG